jgi:hypothetical protein
VPFRFIGGFSIESPDEANHAAQAGVQVAYTYGQTDTGPLGAALHQLGMKQVVGRPEVYLYQFECHRVLTLHLKSYPLSCSRDFPNMTESVMLADIQQSVAGNAHDPNVVGYWVLDDWPLSDTAQAKALLPQIAQIIHSNAPGRPAICSFGGSISPIGTGYDDYIHSVFDSYTPAGCDYPALVVYSEDTSNAKATEADYDWTMNPMLGHMLADLSARGWSAGDGFIGIAQAWSGVLPGSPTMYEVEPTAADLAAQAQAYCRAGAIGVVFYAWAAAGIGHLHTPANDPQLLGGVQQGAQACQQIWAAGT